MRQTSQWSSSRAPPGLQEDAMDIDEQILSDVTSLRASGWEASAIQPFDGTSLHASDTHSASSNTRAFIILDSNVLISYLPLVRELLSSFSRQTPKMALCLPNVVVAELNFLKERNANPNTRALAQEANVWLLASVRSRNGLLRGQQKHEGLEQLENDRARHVRRVNDDQIIDYCEYLLNTTQKENGVVCLLSNDKNCCLKAELKGIMTISPKPGVNTGWIISALLQKIVNPTSSTYASSSTNSLNRAGTTYSPITTKPTAEGYMDIDDDEHITSPSDLHPVSQLHSQFIDHLSGILPQLAYSAAIQEQTRRRVNKDTLSQSNAKPSALYTSIHAPKGGTEVTYGLRAFIMPKQEEVQTWKPLDCIHFVLEFPPDIDATSAKQARNRRPPAIAKLKLFLLAYGQPGGRRGKDWSVGDWKTALEELEQVSFFCGWGTVHECVEICRSQLLSLGLRV